MSHFCQIVNIHAAIPVHQPIITRPVTQSMDGLDRYIVEQAWSCGDITLEKGVVVVMLGDLEKLELEKVLRLKPHPQQVWVRTQQGRTIRIHRQLLSKQSQPFVCQSCEKTTQDGIE